MLKCIIITEEGFVHVVGDISYVKLAQFMDDISATVRTKASEELTTLTRLIEGRGVQQLPLDLPESLTEE